MKSLRSMALHSLATCAAASALLRQDAERYALAIREAGIRLD